MTTFQPRDSRESPRFSGIHTFMGLPHITDPHQLDVALVGIPFDGGTSYRNGTRFGPAEIRVQSKIIDMGCVWGESIVFEGEIRYLY